MKLKVQNVMNNMLKMHMKLPWCKLLHGVAEKGIVSRTFEQVLKKIQVSDSHFVFTLLLYYYITSGFVFHFGSLAFLNNL